MSHLTHIGLLPQGGKNWIAGVIYLQNIIRSIEGLPEGERPRLYMIMNLRQERTVPEDVRLQFPDFLYYAYDRRTSLIDKLRMIKYSLKTRHFPVGLEKLVVDRRLKALFPAQDNLGKDFPVPWIGWTPDFQHKRLPHYFTKEDIKTRDQSYSAIIQEATHVVVSSQDVYDDLMTFFPTDQKRVSILRFVSVFDDEYFAVDPAVTVAEYKLPGKFLIFPSQFWVHKNHRVVFEALKILKGKGMGHVRIVFTGQNFDYRAPEHFNQMTALKDNYGLQDQVFYLGLLERYKQTQLMRAAAAVLQPSYFEGWSSLVEDARSLGKKIYLSNIPIHHEQNPPDAVFFNPDNAQELAEVLARDYDHLPAGPDQDKEATARASQRENTLYFARNFLNIIERASNN